LVLEIDERSFPAIHKVLPGRNLGLTNLQKDQVQRNGDPDFILRKFRGAITKDMTLYLNNEEPRSGSLEEQASKAVYFSVADNSKTYACNDLYSVTLPCPKCGHPIVYNKYNLANIGPFRCTKCDYASHKETDVTISQIDFDKNCFVCGDSSWNVPYNNPFYIYNFAMCIAICRNIGLTDMEIQKGFASFHNRANHRDVIQFKGKEIYYLRGKQENPEALQSQLDIIAADKRKKAVFVGMYEIADFSPYYAGSFYFFDCDFAPIAKTPVERYVVFSSTVSYDTANRIRYAGGEGDKITVLDTEDLTLVLKELENTKTDNIYFLTGMKPYKKLKEYFSKGGNK